MPQVHLPIGGSTAARTLECPGWVKYAANYPSKPAGAAAIAGSMHHEVQELCRLNDQRPADLVGHIYEEDGTKREFLKEDYDLSKFAYVTTDKIFNQLDIDIFEIEPFVQIEPGVSGGSIDVLGLSKDGKELLVLDYKFGRYIVNAKDNPQGVFYAYAALMDPATANLFDDVEKITIVIVQPQSDKGYSKWSINMTEFKAWCARLDHAIKLAQTDGAIRNGGDHCKYCPASAYCDVRYKRATEALQIGTSSDNELAAAGAIVEDVEQWVKEVKETLYLRMMDGHKIDGWKIITNRAVNKWIDPEAAEKYLKSKRIPKKDMYKTTVAFLTAPQILKVVKGKKNIDLSDHIEKKSSGFTIAKADQPGEAVDTTAVPSNLANLAK